MKTYENLLYLGESFSEREMFQTNVIEEIKTHILCSITFYRRLGCLGVNMEKHSYDRSGQAIDNTTHAHCMMDT
jgi:hypothetical protein